MSERIVNGESLVKNKSKMKMGKKLFQTKISLVNMAFNKVNQWIERKQRRLAAYLNQKCEKLSTRQLKMGLALFCMTFGSMVSVSIWHSLHHFSESSKTASISTPKHVLSKDSITLAELKSKQLTYIQKLKSQLDSLRQTKQGQDMWESIKILRPGLADSLRRLEKIYQFIR